MRARQEITGTFYACPIDLTIDMIGRKWQPLILWGLAPGPLHYNTLQALLPRVAHKVLTQELRDLERHHLVTRTVRQSPGGRRVEYALSEFGRTLRPVMNVMCAWANQHHARVGASLDPLPVRDRMARASLRIDQPASRPRRRAK